VTPLHDTEDPDLIAALYGPPLEVVASALRGMFISPPGRDLIGVDYSSIEARVLAWLAGQEDLIEMFFRGADVYVDMARAIGSDNRQLGKVVVLGAGYGMGRRTFRSHAQSWGLDLSEEEAAQAIDAYRAKNHRIRSWWYDLERAALRAVDEPGERISVGPYASFQQRGGFLWLRLPSGRELAYAFPSIVWSETPWGEEKPAVQIWNVNSYTRQWDARTLYGGLIAENATQAVARDVMAEAMVRLEAHPTYDPVLTVHDEVVCEVDRDKGSVDEMVEIMVELPEWATGLPVAAEGWRGTRYRK